MHFHLSMSSHLLLRFYLPHIPMHTYPFSLHGTACHAPLHINGVFYSCHLSVFKLCGLANLCNTVFWLCISLWWNVFVVSHLGRKPHKACSGCQQLIHIRCKKCPSCQTDCTTGRSRFHINDGDLPPKVPSEMFQRMCHKVTIYSLVI